jgi:hypothetical protein
MGVGNRIRLASCCLLISTSVFAAKITGKVTNGTTNKPSAGDDVVLVSLAGGMQETARTKTGSKGEFAIDVPDEDVQHLIRVNHQRVNYFHAAPQGTTTADITVYDSAKKVDNLIGEGRVFRVQLADAQQLRISEMYIVRNESKPPRTWMGDRTLDVLVPEGATLEEGMAAGPGGMPVTSAPVPTGVKNHYAFIFPIRPGRSQLQVTYKLPYNGSHDFAVSPDVPLAEFGVMLPKGMRFTPSGGDFSPASDESGMTVFVAKNIPLGQQLRFSLAGEGTAPREAQGDNDMAAGQGTSSGPGGGLGNPIGAPAPLSATRWYIMGVVLIGLSVGVVWLIRHKPAPAVISRVSRGAPDLHASSTSRSASADQHVPPQTRTAPPAVGGVSVLDAIKDELFQIESERVAGKISEEEYASAKSGLDALLLRQIKKAN